MKSTKQKEYETIACCTDVIFSRIVQKNLHHRAIQPSNNTNHSGSKRKEKKRLRFLFSGQPVLGYLPNAQVELVPPIPISQQKK